MELLKIKGVEFMGPLQEQIMKFVDRQIQI